MKVFKPYGHRIIVEKITEKERAGIILTRDSQKKALIGKVLHVGPEVVDIEPGNIVLFAQFSGCAPYMDSDLRNNYAEDILVMNDEDILSFVVESQATPAAALEATVAGT